MLNIRPLSPELQKKAIEELNEDPHRIPADLEALREWIRKTPHLTSRLDDQFLVSFLRGCKYSLERTKEKLDAFYTIRAHIGEMMMDRDPIKEQIREIIQSGFVIPLPETEFPDSPRISIIRPGTHDIHKHTIVGIIKVINMLQEYMIMNDDSIVVAGQITIVDLADVTMGHFLQYTPMIIKKMTLLGQDSSPVRQKGIHYINTPPGFEQVFHIFKAFLSEKNKSRISLHGSNMESLYKAVPKRLLPKDYGGEAESIKSILVDVEEKMISSRQYFLDDAKYGTDERKRVGIPKNEETLFGIDGSFRQLEFD